jgi:hypothetical protein
MIRQRIEGAGVDYLLDNGIPAEDIELFGQLADVPLQPEKLNTQAVIIGNEVKALRNSVPQYVELSNFVTELQLLLNRQNIATIGMEKVDSHLIQQVESGRLDIRTSRAVLLYTKQLIQGNQKV